MLLIKSLNRICWHPTEQMSSIEEHWCEKRGQLSLSVSTCQSKRAKVDQSHRLRRKHPHSLSADSCYLYEQLLCRSHIILTLPACRLSSVYFRVNRTILKLSVSAFPENIRMIHVQNIKLLIALQIITNLQIGWQMDYIIPLPDVSFLCLLQKMHDLLL